MRGRGFNELTFFCCLPWVFVFLVILMFLFYLFPFVWEVFLGIHVALGRLRKEPGLCFEIRFLVNIVRMDRKGGYTLHYAFNVSRIEIGGVESFRPECSAKCCRLPDEHTFYLCHFLECADEAPII